MQLVMEFLNHIVWDFGDTIGQLRVIHIILFVIAGYYIPTTLGKI